MNRITETRDYKHFCDVVLRGVTFNVWKKRPGTYGRDWAITLDVTNPSNPPTLLCRRWYQIDVKASRGWVEGFEVISETLIDLSKEDLPSWLENKLQDIRGRRIKAHEKYVKKLHKLQDTVSSLDDLLGDRK